jgi:hypothetical protein
MIGKEETPSIWPRESLIDLDHERKAGVHGDAGRLLSDQEA